MAATIANPMELTEQAHEVVCRLTIALWALRGCATSSTLVTAVHAVLDMAFAPGEPDCGDIEAAPTEADPTEGPTGDIEADPTEGPAGLSPT